MAIVRTLLLLGCVFLFSIACQASRGNTSGRGFLSGQPLRKLVVKILWELQQEYGVSNRDRPYDYSLSFAMGDKEREVLILVQYDTVPSDKTQKFINSMMDSIIRDVSKASHGVMLKSIEYGPATGPLHYRVKVIGEGLDRLERVLGED